ncbi:hypothetical protein B0H14DRAFT_3893129 [Mycena olivaceomarginata]|nr:hypothetical protein B0H14DRAFT_3893129 [Mycena olivaceomarginata]
MTFATGSSLIAFLPSFLIRPQGRYELLYPRRRRVYLVDKALTPMFGIPTSPASDATSSPPCASLFSIVSFCYSTALDDAAISKHNMFRGITSYGAGNGSFVSIHNGFQGTASWAGFFPSSDHIVLDTHPCFHGGDDSDSDSDSELDLESDDSQYISISSGSPFYAAHPPVAFQTTFDVPLVPVPSKPLLDDANYSEASVAQFRAEIERVLPSEVKEDLFLVDEGCLRSSSLRPSTRAFPEILLGAVPRPGSMRCGFPGSFPARPFCKRALSPRRPQASPAAAPGIIPFL